MRMRYDPDNWSKVELAAKYIALFLVKWGRVPVRDYKEKYGTVRVYLSFGFYGFHSIIHPQHIYNQWPKWLWTLDCNFGTKIINPFNKLVVPYHCWLYRLAYKRAIKKYPMIKKEILSCADYAELLKGL